MHGRTDNSPRWGGALEQVALLMASRAPRLRHSIVAGEAPSTNRGSVAVRNALQGGHRPLPASKEHLDMKQIDAACDLGSRAPASSRPLGRGALLRRALLVGAAFLPAGGLVAFGGASTPQDVPAVSASDVPILPAPYGSGGGFLAVERNLSGALMGTLHDAQGEPVARMTAVLKSDGQGGATIHGELIDISRDDAGRRIALVEGSMQVLGGMVGVLSGALIDARDGSDVGLFRGQLWLAPGVQRGGLTHGSFDLDWESF